MIHFDAKLIQMVLDKPNGNMKGYPHSKIIWKMLQAMYNRQTSLEKNIQATVEDNGIGFNGLDSRWLSEVAVNSKGYKNLTQAQAKAVAKKLKKYIKQLVQIANEKQPEKAPLPKRKKKEDPELYKSWGGLFDKQPCLKCGVPRNQCSC